MLADAISGLLLTVLGLYAAVKGQTYGLGTLSQPGAGFFPFWAAVLMVSCSAAIAVRALVKLRAGRADVEERKPAATSWRKVWMCVAALLGYTTLLVWFGFGISTFAAMVALCRLDPRTTWRESIVIGALGAAGFWLVFSYALNVSFPQQVIGF
jgi:hypothetical protein